MKVNRGIRRYNDMFPEVVEVETVTTKGRNQELLEQRDTRLCDRFYFLGVVKGMRYEDILVWLEEEFEITKTTISERLQLPELGDYLKEVKAKNPSTSHFRKKWKRMVW